MAETSSSPTLKVLIFSASRRAGSLNTQLAALAAKVAAAHGETVDLASMHDFDVPVYDGDLEGKTGIPPGAQALQRRLLAADAFVIPSPEYNASMPGGRKYLIDWTSRVRPQPFDGRHGQVMSASPSLAGGNRGLWAWPRCPQARRRPGGPRGATRCDGGRGRVDRGGGPGGSQRRTSRLSLRRGPRVHGAAAVNG